MRCPIINRVRVQHLLFAFLVFASIASAVNAAGLENEKTPPRKKIAVIPFTSNNTDADKARMARNAVELALFKTGLYDILEKEHIRLIVEERKRQIDECRDSECAAAIGELVSAGYVVIGSVDRGDTYMVQAKVVDVEKKCIVIAETAAAEESGKIRDAAERISLIITRKIERLGKKSKPGAFSAAFGFVAPLGYLSRKVGFGYGITLSCVAEDLFVNGLQFGGSARFIYFTGKDHEAHHAMMVPVNALAGYRFTVRDFSINPYLGFGGSYSIVYYYRDRETADYTASGAFQPFLLLGLDLTYNFTPMVQLQLKPEYAMTIEKGGIIQFFSAGIGVGVFF